MSVLCLISLKNMALFGQKRRLGSRFRLPLHYGRRRRLLRCGLQLRLAPSVALSVELAPRFRGSAPALPPPASPGASSPKRGQRTRKLRFLLSPLLKFHTLDNQPTSIAFWFLCGLPFPPRRCTSPSRAPPRSSCAKCIPLPARESSKSFSA